MSGYAIGHLRDVIMGPGIVEYLRRIDATLEPFGGRFLIHGGKVDVLEGSWSGDLIVIAFPRVDLARLVRLRGLSGHRGAAARQCSGRDRHHGRRPGDASRNGYSCGMT